MIVRNAFSAYRVSAIGVHHLCRGHGHHAGDAVEAHDHFDGSEGRIDGEAHDSHIDGEAHGNRIDGEAHGSHINCEAVDSHIDCVTGAITLLKPQQRQRNRIHRGESRRDVIQPLEAGVDAAFLHPELVVIRNGRRRI